MRGHHGITAQVIRHLHHPNFTLFYSKLYEYESGALVPQAFPSKRQFVSELLNAFKLFTDTIALY